MIPQVLWSRKVRNNISMLFIVALVVNVGMWLERFVIVVVSLHRDYIPSAWGTYYSDKMGLGDVCRHDRAFLDAVLPFPTLLADDFDRRDAFVGGRNERRKPE